MKRSTALRTARAVYERIRACNGIVGTPEADYAALRVKRAWLFGSTAKGSAEPGDVDILLEIMPCGPRRCVGRGAKLGRRWAERYYNQPPNTKDIALRALRRGRKMVRFHDVAVDGELGDIPETKVMIYPRWDIKEG
jgi:predicted nucleotidyltransferase